MSVAPEERCLRYVSIQYNNGDDHNDEFSWRGIVTDVTEEEAYEAARRARCIRSEAAKYVDGTDYTRHFIWQNTQTNDDIPVDEVITPELEEEEALTAYDLVQYFLFSKPLTEWLADHLVDRSGAAVNSPETLAEVLKSIGASASLSTFQAVMAGEAS